MEYEYADERVRRLFEDELQRNHGAKAVRNRDNRLGEIIGAESLLDLLKLSGLGRWHVLDDRDGGGLEGYISGDITGKQRMLLAPPGVDYSECTLVTIDGLRDTH